ncbi:MAG: hypothetical protein LiPW41_792 [Parcubacteria group bacterium LiPW_41]|nr:MAG: hypothetical protein LiPW41_792 [Parcubacteria group bacterium LiPW_41]
MITEFFAVTRTSIYQIIYDEKTGVVTLEKVYLKGKSAILVGFKMSPKWSQVVIGRSIFWDDWNSSPIAGLFATFEEAKECIESENPIDSDARWETQTRAILDSIGDTHPVFKILPAS